MSRKIAIAPYHEIELDLYFEKGGVVLGPYSSYIWRTDPRHLCFLLARYKFTAKMLEGKKEVLEVGCGDSFGTALVLQTVGKVHAIDLEPAVIEDNIKRLAYGTCCTYEVLDITSGPINKKFDGAFALDVIEHIPNELEQKFISNICKSLKTNGLCIIGTPNISAQEYASAGSKAGHINLKSMQSLRELMEQYFENVFMFGMNDEVLHTGYPSMCHYIWSVAAGVKKELFEDK